MKQLALGLLTIAACTASENVGNTSPDPDAGHGDAAEYTRVPVFGAERWHITIDGPEDDRAGPVAVAADGDLVFTGTFQATVDLGFGPVTSERNADGRFCSTAFVTKRSRLDGSPRWTRLIPGRMPTGNDCASTNISSVAVDPNGGIFVVGDYAGRAELGATTLQATRYDMFVAKYSNDGDVIWARGLGPGSRALGQEAAAASDGSLAVVGRVYGVFETPSGPVGDDATDPYSEDPIDIADPFVLVLEPEGAMRWARVFPHTAPAFVQCNDLAVAPNRDVVITCLARAPFSFGGHVIAAERVRGMMARFTPSGDLVWSVGIGDPTSESWPPAVEVTLSGGVVTLAGEPTNLDATVRGFDAEGNQLWMRRARSGRTDIRVVSVDRAGRVLLHGRTGGPADLGFGQLAADDVFLLALDSDGTPLDQAIQPDGARGPWRQFLAPLDDGSLAFTGAFDNHEVPGNIVFGLLDPPAP